jgi:hypothetical protein
MAIRVIRRAAFCQVSRVLLGRRHCEPTDKTRAPPHFDFDIVSASDVGRVLDGVLIASTIELEDAQYLPVSSEEIDLVRGHL